MVAASQRSQAEFRKPLFDRLADHGRQLVGNPTPARTHRDRRFCGITLLIAMVSLAIEKEISSWRLEQARLVG
jgi:hypothetical protein